MLSIGRNRRVTVAIFQNFGLAPFRNILTPKDFAAVAEQTGCAPKRNRALVPEVVAWLMMYVGLYTASMTQGLCQAWGLVRAVCPGLTEHGVTEEAFCQARRRLPLAFWRRLFGDLTRRYTRRFDAGMRWKGT